MENYKIINGNCWVSCFDILGFGERVNELKEHPDVFVEVYYRNILRKSISLCNSNNEVLSKVHFLWFSDTFIFVTEDDSFGSYVLVNQLSRRFFDTQIISGLPLQGALSVGQIYYSKNENIIVGTSLIDAYKYAEGQNWIGFVLTPEARKKLNQYGMRDRINYVEHDVPIKQKKKVSGKSQIELGTEKLFAYNLNKSPYKLDQKIKQMQQEAKNRYPKDYEEKYKEKYENALKFIRDTKLH